MDKRELQELLSQAYNQENWKNIVQFVFPNVTLLTTPLEFPINNDKIKKFRQLGNVRLNDGKNLALFELLLSDSVNIQRNRVDLNNEISKYIDQNTIHGVLSVFEQGTDDYRFTFSASSSEFQEEEGDFVQKKTDTKRFTYLLGKNESCRTPAERFFRLSEKKGSADINTIQNAFSVEQLSKEFFDKYKKQFEKFWKYIHSNKDFKRISFGEDREKGIRDFTKKLLGRIVFLHFLQKKGWMGCTAGINKWEDGDKQFMQTLFENYSNQSEFHSICLAELFYNTLNKKRIGELFKCDGLKGILNNSKVPYLNGGLFDSDEDITRKIDFPASYFQELFDFFGQYNFTIDENDPNDHEVGIDPEMLGHIFENLLEDNKDKGAFYTPKVIVQYMCQESIIEYINTKINNGENTEVKIAIEDLIRNKLAEKCSNLDLVQPISKALFEVKICDPAIGSGAFPMGILNVIYQAIEELFFIQPDSVATIWNISDTEWQPHLVKKNIIQHSIYGVDLESGAVDIARLRFWLALVVDEIEPLPLPNLDYKIMQGNSLLESFEGIDLSQISDASAYEEIYESEQIDMFSGEAKKSVSISLNFDDIKSLMDEYFNANDPDTKKEIHKKIDDQVINHIRFTLLQHKQSLVTKKTPLERKLKLDEASASTLHQKEKVRTTSKQAKELAKISSELNLLNGKEIKLAQLSNSNERPFFLWHLFFKEVFDDGGFDIVIGNPPYLGEKGNKPSFRPIQFSPLGELYYKGQMDLFYYFFHKSLDILKTKGTLNFITTNYFITADGAIKLRTDIKERTQIIRIINFNELRIFETALGQHNLITLLKKDNIPVETKIQISTSKSSFRISFVVDFLNNNLKDSISFKRNSNSLFEGENNYIRLHNSNIDSQSEKILQKISTDTVQLGNEFLINAGIGVTIGKLSKKYLKEYPNLNISSGDGVFVVNNVESFNMESEIVKPFVKNSDISHYKYNLSSDRLIYLTRNDNLELYPNIERHMLKFKPILDDQIIAYEEEFPWYALNRPRNIDVFEDNDKIIFPYRSKLNSFAYSDSPVFGSRDVLFIRKKNNSQSIKSLLALLNSKIMYYWLYNKGKRKGEILEMVKSPISEIPFKKFDFETSEILENKVNQILKESNRDSLKILKTEIDDILYMFYALTEEEIFIIENSCK